ncbi:chaperone modulator CbpM [Mucilaginibacter gilvus]|uniref:MerR family transcriptional regulator n=1 Tax=Mucilaginibacter gilvus TaxID=2305909 RepID=A0A3S3UYA9_9SPHI|nr:chaperone modulator CbpM [Mucilaginibacter gilvus]RWY51066.1 MerR family transcriptional regulator [Mucilaginibacter gilvus]
MKTENLITVTDFCLYHNVEYTFIDHLQEAGLIEVTIINQTTCIPVHEIRKAERLARLHTQLDINEPGILVIDSLLDKVENMQQELAVLRSRLRLYEG